MFFLLFAFLGSYRPNPFPVCTRTPTCAQKRKRKKQRPLLKVFVIPIYSFYMAKTVFQSGCKVQVTHYSRSRPACGSYLRLRCGTLSGTRRRSDCPSEPIEVLGRRQSNQGRPSLTCLRRRNVVRHSYPGQVMHWMTSMRYGANPTTRGRLRQDPLSHSHYPGLMMLCYVTAGAWSERSLEGGEQISFAWRVSVRQRHSTMKGTREYHPYCDIGTWYECVFFPFCLYNKS